MLLPEIFGENFFNDWMDDPWKYVYGAPAARQAEAQRPAHPHHQMRTDIKENENGYELSMELPGYKKEDVNAELKEGYLTITAKHEQNNDEKDDKGNYIRRERYYGTCSRSFFVGKDVEPEDISAKFEDGILKLGIPKKDEKQVEQKKLISIEG